MNVSLEGLQGFLTTRGRKAARALGCATTFVRLTLCRWVCCRNLRFGKRVVLGRGVRFSIRNTAEVRVGDDVRMERFSSVIVRDHARLALGEGVYMNEGCIISCLEQVVVGDGVLMGPGVCIFDNNHRFDAHSGVSGEIASRPVMIGRGVWLGARAAVLAGAKIGEGCVIGAGCVIKGEVPPHCIVTAGHEQHCRPCRPIREQSERQEGSGT